MAYFKPAGRAEIRRWKRKAQARYFRASVGLFFAVIRYHLLCFKHFGRIRLAVFFLELPEVPKTVFLALFAHPRDQPKEGRWHRDI